MRTLFLLAFAFLLALPATAQTESGVVPAPEARPSPLAIAKTMLDDGTYVKVVYGSPQMRGRDIFGGLVPLGEVWRTGANEATELTTTGDIMLGDTRVPAGTYALFTIPGEDSWTIILNRALGQWGAYEYDPAHDAARFEVDVDDASPRYEAFTIEFVDDDGMGQVYLKMMWDDVVVSIPVAPASV